MQRIKLTTENRHPLRICTKCGLPQRANNLFAAQAIGNVLKSKIYSGILPRVVDG
jgi:hypothetical protein